jgi:Domain of unknown function (DUF4864)
MTARGKITLLTFFFAMCGTVAVLTAYLQTRADENVKPADLYAVVERQLGDFRGGDFPRAYESASREIQARYSEEQFAAMVQSDYPGMTQVCGAEYGLVQTRGRHATMQVYLIGQDGEIMPCVYMLVREGDSWRIDGARLMHPWPPNVRMEGTML